MFGLRLRAMLVHRALGSAGSIREASEGGGEGLRVEGEESSGLRKQRKRKIEKHNMLVDVNLGRWKGEKWARAEGIR